MDEYVVYAILLVILFTGTTGQVSSSDDYSEPTAEVAYCQPYCDIFGYYKPGAWCISYDGPVYCCGDENYRYCCGDPNDNITDKYDPVKECPNSSWWVTHWRVIIGVLGTLVTVVIVSACCYYCCVHFFSKKRRRETSDEREVDLPSVASAGGATGGVSFDPQHPYAFVPPDYDSLPKEPPKYAEVFERDNEYANINEGFEPDFPSPPPQEGNSPGQEPETPPPMYEFVPVHTTHVPVQNDVSVNPFSGLPLADGAGTNTVNPSAT